jgi:hypothetical protein
MQQQEEEEEEWEEFGESWEDAHIVSQEGQLRHVSGRRAH